MKPKKRRHKSKNSVRLMVERLEDRIVPDGMQPNNAATAWPRDENLSGPRDTRLAKHRHRDAVTIH